VVQWAKPKCQVSSAAPQLEGKEKKRNEVFEKLTIKLRESGKTQKAQHITIKLTWQRLVGKSTKPVSVKMEQTVKS